MNEITIRKCQNGWIVTPLFNEQQFGMPPMIKEAHVYRTIEEIQKALPELLKEPVQGQDTVKGFSPP